MLTARLLRAGPRRSEGQAQTELPLVLFVLFTLLFFPLIALLSLGVSYGCCATLNSIQLREAALIAKSQAENQAGPVKHNIVETWKSTGIGKFAKLVGDPQTDVSYIDGVTDPISGIADKVVVVSTTCELAPFLPQSSSFLPKAPGLNQPITLSFSSQRPLENQDNYKL